MNRTLLYTVQRVLEKLDLDPVNSINDTPDAILVAREAENTFYDLVSRNEWPERYDILNIESVGDTSNPTALRLPTNVLNIISLRYNVTDVGESDKVFKELTQVTPEEFMDSVYARNSSDSDVTTASYKGIELFVYNDQHPSFFTVFDNNIIVLDSWKSTKETTVQGVNTIARGSSVPTFELTDEYIVPMDVNTYPLFLSELTASASIALTGSQAIEEERRRTVGISRMRRAAYRTGTPDLRNKFGRKGTGRD